MSRDEVKPGSIVTPKNGRRFRDGLPQLTVLRIAREHVHFKEDVPSIRMKFLMEIATVVEPQDAPLPPAIKRRHDISPKEFLAMAATAAKIYGVGIDLRDQTNAAAAMREELEWGHE